MQTQADTKSDKPVVTVGSASAAGQPPNLAGAAGDIKQPLAEIRWDLVDPSFPAFFPNPVSLTTNWESIAVLQPPLSVPPPTTEVRLKKEASLDDCCELYFSGNFTMAAVQFKLSWQSNKKNYLLFLGYIASLLATDKPKDREQASKELVTFLTKDGVQWLGYDIKQKLFFLLEQIGVIKSPDNEQMESYFKFYGLAKTPPKVLIKGILIDAFLQSSKEKSRAITRFSSEYVSDEHQYVKSVSMQLLVENGDMPLFAFVNELELLIKANPHAVIYKCLLAKYLLLDPACDKAQAMRAVQLYTEASLEGYSPADIALVTLYQGYKHPITQVQLIDPDNSKELEHAAKSAKQKDKIGMTKAAYLAAKLTPSSAFTMFENAAADYEGALYALSIIIINFHFGPLLNARDDRLEHIANDSKARELMCRYSIEDANAMMNRIALVPQYAGAAIDAMQFIAFFKSAYLIPPANKTFKQLYEESAQGDLDSRIALGQHLLNVPVIENSHLFAIGLSLLANAASKGRIQAKVILSNLYLNGKKSVAPADKTIIMPDPVLSKKLLLESEVKGNGSAYFELYLRHGQRLAGYDAGPFKAFQYLILAHDANEKQASLVLGLFIAAYFYNMKLAKLTQSGLAKPMPITFVGGERAHVFNNDEVKSYIRDKYSVYDAVKFLEAGLAVKEDENIRELLKMVQGAFPETLPKVVEARSKHPKKPVPSSKLTEAAAAASATAPATSSDSKKKKSKHQKPSAPVKYQATRSAKTAAKTSPPVVVQLKQQERETPKLDIKKADEEARERQAAQRELQSALDKVAAFEERYQASLKDAKDQRALSQKALRRSETFRRRLTENITENQALTSAIESQRKEIAARIVSVEEASRRQAAILEQSLAVSTRVAAEIAEREAIAREKELAAANAAAVQAGIKERADKLAAEIAAEQAVRKQALEKAEAIAAKKYADRVRKLDAEIKASHARERLLADQIKQLTLKGTRTAELIEHLAGRQKVLTLAIGDITVRENRTKDSIAKVDQNLMLSKMRINDNDECIKAIEAKIASVTAHIKQIDASIESCKQRRIVATTHLYEIQKLSAQLNWMKELELDSERRQKIIEEGRENEAKEAAENAAKDLAEKEALAKQLERDIALESLRQIELFRALLKNNDSKEVYDGAVNAITVLTGDKRFAGIANDYLGNLIKLRDEASAKMQTLARMQPTKPQTVVALQPTAQAVADRKQDLTLQQSMPALEVYTQQAVRVIEHTQHPPAGMVMPYYPAASAQGVIFFYDPNQPNSGFFANLAGQRLPVATVTGPQPVLTHVSLNKYSK